MLILSIFIFITGLVIGSFLNVCIYRLPRGESLIFPPSHCPECGSPIRWYDNIPLVSYLLLKGRCRTCSHAISPVYPLVEGACGLLYLLTFLSHYLKTFSLLAFFKDILFISFLIPIFFIDLKNQIIPNSLSYGLLMAGIIFGYLEGSFLQSLLGAGTGTGILLGVYFLGYLFLRQESFGIGDVKLAAGIGAFLGWRKALLCLFLSFILGGLLCGLLLLLHLKERRDKIPFAPFLVTGALLSIFLGEKLIYLYLTGWP